jgi:hypothetical protein
MRGKAQVKAGNAPREPAFEVIVDPSLDQQVVGGGLLVFWWTKDDGRREGMLCEIQLCPVPMCPCREAEIHAVRVGPEATLRPHAALKFRATGWLPGEVQVVSEADVGLKFE